MDHLATVEAQEAGWRRARQRSGGLGPGGLVPEIFLMRSPGKANGTEMYLELLEFLTRK